MTPIGLARIGAFVSDNRLTNQDLEKKVDTTDEWILRRTGIRERRIAPPGMHASEMATAAARACLAGSDAQPGLVVASCGTAEQSSPYQASIIAHHLNLSRVAAFDLNAACSGLVYGLAVASSLMQTAGYSHALVTAGEKMSMFTDYQDRKSCVLFGDGAAAILLATENWEHELLHTELDCDPSGAYYVQMGDREGSPFFRQDGPKVFKFAVNTLHQMLDRLLQRCGVGEKETFHVIPHQANLRMIEAVAEQRNLPMERFVMNIDRYGNTSSASIGLALEEAWKTDRFQKGDYVFLIGFGGGLSRAGAAIRW
jgi:3-oxoacyl-[acyl-carrier-protein] synthase III